MISLPILADQDSLNNSKHYNSTDKLEETPTNCKRMSEEGQYLKEMVSLFKQYLQNNKKQQIIGSKLNNRELYHQLQPRDRLILIQLPESSCQLQKQCLQKYITQLCKVVWSRAFYYFSTNQLSYQHTKIYSSQQILNNIVRLSQKNHLKNSHFQIINAHIQNKILEYMFNKYPITLSQDINRNLYNNFRDVDNTDQLVNDYLYNSSIVFKFKEGAEYNDLIMRTINEVLKKIQFRVRGRSIYQKFQEKMEGMFESVSDQNWMKENDQIQKNQFNLGTNDMAELSPPNNIKRIFSQQQLKFKKDILKIEQKQKQKYRLKVKQYTTYSIGRKLPESTRLFTQEQILSHNIKIQSPQVLRLLTKWCEQLQNKFSTPNYFQHYIQTLKLQNGKFVILVLNQMKESLDQLMVQERRKINIQIQQLSKNNYFMQSQLLMKELLTTGCNQIQKYERIASRYSIDIVNNLHSYIIFYLNRLIHGLLTVGIKFTKLPFFNHIELPSNINLITFQVMDLIRCKCASGQKQILRIYAEILKISQTSPNFKIVRVVNRLKRGTRDILINVRYHEVLCQVQLAVTSRYNKFIQYSNMFNHYLYELKRSVFGPLTELCSIWKCLDVKFNFYKSLNPIQFHNPSTSTLHKCKQQTQYEIFNKPFLCSKCNVHYFHNNYIKHHLKCQQCNYWLCARCQIDSMDCTTLLSAAYKNVQIIKKCVWSKEKYGKISDFGICIYVESQQIKVEPFRKYSYKNMVKIIGVKNKILYQIYDISSDQFQAVFREKFLIFQLNNSFGKKHIKIDDQKIRQFLIQQKLKNVYQKNKQRICLNHQDITTEQLQRLIEFGSVAQKINVKKIQIIGNKLQKVQTIARQFKNIKTLQMSKNNIVNFQGIEKLQKLQKLYVNQNKVKQLPTQVCHLWNLKELSFCWNDIKSLPPDLAKLHKLKALKLSNNKMEDIPLCITQLCYLDQLNLKNNFIKEIPAQIGALNELEVLELQNNQIENIHDNIGRLTNLQILNLSNNHIKLLPNSFGSLKTMSRCSLKNNKIVKIPSLINELQNLLDLDLSNNQIQELPPFNFLFKLKYLNINSNKLALLPQLTGLLQLRMLSLTHNQLKTLPSIQILSNLQQLYLNCNILESVHDSLGRLQKLQILHLQHNELSSLCDLKLQRLRLLISSNNKLTSFSNMDLISLQQLDLSKNKINKFTLNLLPAVRRIFINQNQLQSIDLINYPKLKYIHIGANKLTKLPDIAQKNHLKSINIEHNQISEFPLNLQHFRNLNQLNLSNNLIKVIPKQLQLFSTFPQRSIQISHNPIQKIQCCQLINQKGSKQTVQEYSTFLKPAQPTNLQQLRSFNDQ